jgi:hypothetical protein
MPALNNKQLYLGNRGKQISHDIWDHTNSPFWRSMNAEKLMN